MSPAILVSPAMHSSSSSSSVCASTPASSSVSNKPRKLVFRPLTFDKSRSSRHISISGPLHVETSNEYVLSSNSPMSSRSARSVSFPSSSINVRPRRAANPAITPTLTRSNDSISALFNKLDNELRKSHTHVTLDDHLALIVPTIVQKCVNFLESKDPVQGVFRINGSIRKIKRIELAIHQKGIDSFDFDTFRLDGDDGPNCYDVAMVLKRWLANLENGLITPQINSKLKRDRLSHLDSSFDEEEERELENYNDGYIADTDNDTTMADTSVATVLIHESLHPIEHAKSPEQEKETTNDTSSATCTSSHSSSAISSSFDHLVSEPHSLTICRLSKLPTENLHLFLYLLGFLNRLSREPTVSITKMTASNLAKIFQLSFFKSDDLTSSHPIFTTSALAEESSESLLESYKVNEDLLHSWIDSYDEIRHGLESSVSSKDADFQELLSHPSDPVYEPEARVPTNPLSSLDKVSKRRSMFGYRSFSNMFSSSSFSLASSRKSSYSSSCDEIDSTSVSCSPVENLKTGGASKSGAPVTSNGAKQHKESRSVSAPVRSSWGRKPLGEKSISSLESKQNVCVSSEKAKRINTPARRRPRSMFIERRLSSLFPTHDHHVQLDHHNQLDQHDQHDNHDHHNHHDHHSSTSTDIENNMLATKHILQKLLSPVFINAGKDMTDEDNVRPQPEFSNGMKDPDNLQGDRRSSQNSSVTEIEMDDLVEQQIHNDYERFFTQQQDSQSASLWKGTDSTPVDLAADVSGNVNVNSNFSMSVDKAPSAVSTGSTEPSTLPHSLQSPGPTLSTNVPTSFFSNESMPSLSSPSVSTSSPSTPSLSTLPPTTLPPSTMPPSTLPTYASSTSTASLPTAPLPPTEEELKKIRKRSTMMAIYVGLMSALGELIYGYDTGVINSMLEMSYVRRHFPSNGKSFSTTEVSVVTAILSVGTFFGALSSPLLSDRIGRKWCIVVDCSVIFNIGIILQVISDAIPLLCIGRFISGFGVGIISAVIPLYQAETAPKWIRGSIISFSQWAITVGLLISSAVSQGTHDMDSSACYRIPIGLQLIISCILSVIMCFLPESPRYYVKCGRLDDAIMSLSKLRRLPPDDEFLIEELIEIKASYDYEVSFGSTSLLDCFRNSPGRVCQRKRMFTGIMLQAFQQCSGINFIFYYGVNFFVRIGIGQSYLISFITYLVNVIFTIPGIFFVEILGRRTLLLTGAIGMTVCNYIIGIVGVETNSITANKIMIVFVCGFISFFAATWGPVCWVTVGEIYSLSVRQKAVSICAATNWFINFIFAYATPYLVDTGSHTAALGTKIFFLWGSLNITGFVFVYFMVFETKGLMLEEIDELYRVCKVASKSAAYKGRVNGISEQISLRQSGEGGDPTFPKEEEDSNDTGNTSITPVTPIPSPALVSDDSIMIPPMHVTDDEVSQGNTDDGNGFNRSALLMDSILHIPNDQPPSIISEEEADDSHVDDDPLFPDPGRDSSLDVLAYGDDTFNSRPRGADYMYTNQEDLLNFMQTLSSRVAQMPVESSHSSTAATQSDASSTSGSNSSSN
ncbi:hypothetical protein FOA43_000194 [Brettanomyces nanus]|uniref:Major facilitator superfamily (MFS) profile domain-containing protein n=1 Tax=Eeniella nana TaxID=13502 RepID=A0A875RVH2_EENNA|nr:uncharacterized protein FOA43_000194 [Brettanomyces nanus]QPG72891.1 hypothetical protein FOA43_000194 [Brettanomyces nanus]